MSLIVFMETDIGLILAGDSRLSRKTDPNWHRDDAEKIFDCKGKVGIAYHGDADIDGEPMDAIIMSFIDTVEENDSIEQILYKMQRHIANKGKPNSFFYLLGYENAKKKIYKFNLADNIVSDLSDSVHGTGGKDDFAWPVLQGRFDIHKTNEEAIALSKKIYEMTMENVDTVGGAIDIMFIPFNSKIRWIQRK